MTGFLVLSGLMCNIKKFCRAFVVLFSFLFFGAGSLLLGFVVIPLMSLFIKKENRRKVFCTVVHNLWSFFSNFMQKTGSIKLNVTQPQRNFLTNLKGCVVAANHPSYIDIVLLIGLIPNSLCVVKKEVKKNPVMSNIVKSAYIINDEKEETLKNEAKQALDAGYNVIIFPAGTRTTDDKPLKLHSGAASVAVFADAPIVPLHISCDYKFLAKHQKIYDAGEKPVNYYIKINETIRVDDFKTPDITETKLRRRINAALKQRI